MSYGECEFATPECPEYFKPSKSGGNQENGCFSDEHHTYPLSEYDKGTRLKFARLGENVIRLCRWEHRDIHANKDYPPEPSIEYINERLEANGRKQNR